MINMRGLAQMNHDGLFSAIKLSPLKAETRLNLHLLSSYMILYSISFVPKCVDTILLDALRHKADAFAIFP